MTDDSRAHPARKQNVRMLGKLSVVVVLMFGFGYALVPFYKKVFETGSVNELTQKDGGTAAASRQRSSGHDIRHYR